MKKTLKKFNEFISYGIENEFNDISKKMEEEVIAYSSPSMISENDQYLKLKKMGNDAVPLIINKINELSSISYFMLMVDIVGDIGISKSNKGNMKLMRNDWNNWWNNNKIKYEVR